MNLLNSLGWVPKSPLPTPPPGLPLAGKLSGNDSRNPCQSDRQTWRKPSPHYAVAVALRDARRPLTITELAYAMGVSVGESSKRVKAARSILRIKRSGRCKLVRLKSMSLPEWMALFDDGRPS